MDSKELMKIRLLKTYEHCTYESITEVVDNLPGIFNSSDEDMFLFAAYIIEKFIPGGNQDES